MLNKKKNNKGFTLVELLVVIAIIGILAVVAVPALFKNIEKAKVADLEADISAIKSASMSVYADTGVYPVGADIAAIKASLAKEIDDLSNPFDGGYKLVGTVPANLTIEITPKSGQSFSTNVLDKVKKELNIVEADAKADKITYTLLKAN